MILTKWENSSDAQLQTLATMWSKELRQRERKNIAMGSE